MSKVITVVSRLLVRSGIASLFLRRRQKSPAPQAIILTYHRIGDRYQNQLYPDPQLVSASPAGFAWQMAYLRQNFSLLPMNELIDRYYGERSLPSNIALITFDDGYLDNFDLAYPVLRKYDIPAIIFLITGYIGTSRISWWDELAILLTRTKAGTISLPGLGKLDLDGPSRHSKAWQKLRGYFKTLTENERAELLEMLRQTIITESVTVPRQPFFLSWNQVREMSSNGISFGAHTHSHSILTRISEDEAEKEVATSKRIIETELGKPVRFFAYPNGKTGDFNAQTRQILKRCGFEVAMTLVHGCNSLTSKQFDWLQLRRIYIGSDDQATFIAKISGALEAFTPRLTPASYHYH